jgi:hypothetical protein
MEDKAKVRKYDATAHLHVKKNKLIELKRPQISKQSKLLEAYKLAKFPPQPLSVSGRHTPKQAG